ncbi:RNA polymerase sigma factor [Fredinandcohnia humi]
MGELNSVNMTDSTDKLVLFEDLFTRYKPDVMAMAHFYLKDLYVAEDITQEVFLSCYLNIEKFNWKSKFKTWIFVITRNKCLDYYRSKYSKNILMKEPFNEEIMDTSYNPETKLLEVERDQKFEHDFNKLPPKYKEVLYLYYFEGLKIRDIHNKTNISEDTIKTRLKRGKEKLRRMLA